MSDTGRLLELIEKGIVEHGGDLGGWTRRMDDTLQLFDGRVTLRAELKEAGTSGADGAVHAHVFTTLHEHDDEVLDVDGAYTLQRPSSPIVSEGSPPKGCESIKAGKALCFTFRLGRLACFSRS